MYWTMYWSLQCSLSYHKSYTFMNKYLYITPTHTLGYLMLTPCGYWKISASTSPSFPSLLTDKWQLIFPFISCRFVWLKAWHIPCNIYMSQQIPLPSLPFLAQLNKHKLATDFIHKGIWEHSDVFSIFIIGTTGFMHSLISRTINGTLLSSNVVAIIV